MTVIDFHVHSKRTSKAPFDAADFNLAVAKAKAGNIDCLAITEHAHAKGFQEAYDYLRKNYQYAGNHYFADGVRFFVGVEVSVSEGFDIVCIGDRDDIISLQKRCPNMRGELTVCELFSLLNNDMLVILAHPYRKQKDICLPQNIIDRIDAIEINANELSKSGTKICKSRQEQMEHLEKSMLEHKAKIQHLAHILGKPAIAGSDSHYPTRIGSVKTVLNQITNDLADIKSLILQNEFTVEISFDMLIKR